ncbi:MAG: STAS domain-containing protein [bacterium]|nr:STAS domain-containing protein [bacterium]
MEFEVERHGNVAVVRVPGDHLDASNAPDFKEKTAAIVDANPKLVFDLSALGFVDSSGLGAILSCLRHTNKAGGDLKLCGITQPVRALFELVRMHRVFDIFDTADEAVRAYED